MTDVSLYELDLRLQSLQANRHVQGTWPPVRIVDVGGNYGGTTIALARLFPHAKIVVLEPNPLLCRFALWNFRIHGLLSRIWPVCVGLGEHDQTLAMEICSQP